MAKKQNDLVSFPIHVSSEVERLFDEMIHRPWGFCREMRGWNPSVDLYEPMMLSCWKLISLASSAMM